MRNYLILFALSFSITSFSQDYPEMVVEGATWINIYPTLSFDKDYFVYHIEGDTSVNDVDYKVLNMQDFEIGADDILRLLDTGTPVALLREDVAEKTVYAILLDAFEFVAGDLEDFQMSRVEGENENEYVLYDFGLDVGDVIEAQLPRNIFSISDQVWFDYEVRNFILDPGGDYYEKIGNPLTLFHPFQIAFIAGGGSQVVHYCGDDSEPCLYLTKPLSNNNVERLNFSIFPNPANNYITFSLGDKQMQSIRLYASDGRLVHSLIDISVNELEIDLSSIHYTGLMHVVYESENRSYVESFVKM